MNSSSRIGSGGSHRPLARRHHEPAQVAQLAEGGSDDGLDGKLEMDMRAPSRPGRRKQEAVAKRVAAGALRAADGDLVNSIVHPAAKAKRKFNFDRDVARLEEELSEEIGTTIQIKPGRKGAGKLIVTYSSADHLDDLLSRFRRKRLS